MESVGYGLATLSLLNDVIDASNGKNDAKYSAFLTTFNTLRDFGASKLSMSELQLALAGVAFIDYALNQYISYVTGTHEQVWWNAYLAYMEAKHPRPLRWAILANDQGAEAVDQQLKKFWDNAELNAIEFYTLSASLPPNFANVSGKFLEDYRAGFAARYYRDFVHETVLTYNRRMAEKAFIEMQLSTEAAGKEVALAADELNVLRKVFASGILDQENAAENGSEFAEQTETQPVGGFGKEPATDLTNILARAGALSASIQRQCGLAASSLEEGLTSLQSLEVQLGDLGSSSTSAQPGPDLTAAVERATRLAADSNAALQRVGDARSQAQQAALALCQSSESIANSDCEDARHVYDSLKRQNNDVSQQLSSAQSGAQDALAAATAAGKLVSDSQASLQTASAPGANLEGVTATLASSRATYKSGTSAVQSLLSIQGELTGLRGGADATAASNPQYAVLIAQVVAAEQESQHCVASSETRLADLGSRLGDADARLRSLTAAPSTAASQAGDPALVQRIIDLHRDASASADTAEIFAEAVANVAQQSAQCLSIAENALRKQDDIAQESTQQAINTATAALDRCDLGAFQTARAQITGMQGLLLDQRYQNVLQGKQVADSAIQNAERERRECRYDSARATLREALSRVSCKKEQQRLNDAIANSAQAAERDEYVDTLIAHAAQRDGKEALDILNSAEQWATCARQKYRLSEARAKAQQALQADPRRGGNPQRGPRAQLAETNCPVNAEAFWDASVQEPRCRCLSGYQYEQARGSCLQTNAEPGFDEVMQGLLGAVEVIQEPPREQNRVQNQAPSNPATSGASQFTPTTIRGWWRGSCPYADNVDGRYEAIISRDGALHGAFGGDDSGPIDGKIQGSGQLRAGAGTSGECTWTGTVRQDAQGRTSAGGNWACQDGCRGSWGQ